MKCAPCSASNAPVKGSPFPGYCDACGWALVLVDGKETSRLVGAPPSAMALIAIACGDPGPALRNMAAEVERRSAPTTDEIEAIKARVAAESEAFFSHVAAAGTLVLVRPGAVSEAPITISIALDEKDGAS